jgi:hypothetical protein
MAAIRKVTVEVPEDILRRAQEATGEGVTETIRRGLERIARDRAYEELLKLEGKVKFRYTWKELRDIDE